jgi:hypothetical protein
MNLRKLVMVAILALSVAAASISVIGVRAQSCGTTLTVTPANLQNWQIQITDTQTVTFVNGPATPPLGIGSARLSVGADGDGAAQLRNPDYAGTKLSDLTKLKYATYVQQYGSGGQAPYIILNVDYDGNGTVDDLLFFEPVYQDATFFPSNPQPSLVLDTWQTWDALNGGWWSVDGTAGANPGTGVKSLSTIIAAQPDATIVNSSTGLGGVRIVAGFGAGAWDNFIGNVDAFTLGIGNCDTTFNFEPQVGPPTTANQCKKDGWKSFNTPRPFKNQGDCIQFVNTGK